MDKRIIDITQLAIVPIILMVYGWYLGQLHQSGYDIAGILLFFTGLIGLAIAYGIYFVTKKKIWNGKWYINILTGIIGCAIVFIAIIIYARIYK